MSEYRRYFVPGGTYFLTVVTHRRRTMLTTELARRCLHEAIDAVRRQWPFDIPAIILLPDHWHALVALPPGDDRYAARLRRIKASFTQRYLAAGGCEGDRSPSRRKRMERGIWQRRFWEHTIDGENDFDRHFDYIHYNAVKHGHVQSPADWPYSSFHRWAQRGVYEIGWGRGTMDFSDLEVTTGE